MCHARMKVFVMCVLLELIASADAANKRFAASAEAISSSNTHITKRLQGHFLFVPELVEALARKLLLFVTPSLAMNVKLHLTCSFLL